MVHCKTLSIEGDEMKPVLCTLRASTFEQANLSLVFGYDVPATFSITGDAKAVVYLSGYLQPGPDDGDAGDVRTSIAFIVSFYHHIESILG